MIRPPLLVLDCPDDCLRAIADIAPRSFGSLHLLTDRGPLVRLASRWDAPVVVLPLDGAGVPAVPLIHELLLTSPAARVALFLGARSGKGSDVVEAIRAGAADVLVDGQDWAGIFARPRERPRPLPHRP